jgi:hypothetical protein
MLMEFFIVSPFFSCYGKLPCGETKTPPMFILCKTGGDVPLMTLFCGYVPQRGYFLPAVFRDCDGRMGTVPARITTGSFCPASCG